MGNSNYKCVAESALNDSRKWHFLRNLFCEWSFSMVLDARKRFAEYFSAEISNSHLITRRMFWEIFSDYSTESFKANSSKFISLSLDVYPLFEVKLKEQAKEVNQVVSMLQNESLQVSLACEAEEALETDEQEREQEQEQSLSVCDAREVFALLAFASSGASLSKKLECLFPLFGAEMTSQRVAQLFGCVTRSLFHLNVLQQHVPFQDNEVLASKIFSSAGYKKCRTVSAQLLGDYLLTREEFAPLLRLFISESEQKNGRLNTLMINDKELRDLSKRNSKMKKVVKGLLQNVDQMNKALQKENRKNMRRRNQGARNLVSKMEASGKVDFVLQQQMKKQREVKLHREREQAKVRKAKRVALREIHNLTPSGFQKLRAKWLPHKIGDKGKGISSDRFAEAMMQECPVFQDRYLAAQLFKIFDKNNDGFVTFAEFVVGALKLKAETMKGKVSLLFATFAVKRKVVHPETQSTHEEVGMKVNDLVKIIQNANSEVLVRLFLPLCFLIFIGMCSLGGAVDYNDGC